MHAAGPGVDMDDALDELSSYGGITNPHLLSMAQRLVDWGADVNARAPLHNAVKMDSTDTNSYCRILDPYELRIILDHSTWAMHVDFSARISRISICLAAESIRTSIH